jgi:hypothetical protein
MCKNNMPLTSYTLKLGKFGGHDLVSFTGLDGSHHLMFFTCQLVTKSTGGIITPYLGASSKLNIAVKQLDDSSFGQIGYGSSKLLPPKDCIPSITPLFPLGGDAFSVLIEGGWVEEGVPCDWAQLSQGDKIDVNTSFAYEKFNLIGYESICKKPFNGSIVMPNDKVITEAARFVANKTDFKKLYESADSGAVQVLFGELKEVVCEINDLGL